MAVEAKFREQFVEELTDDEVAVYDRQIRLFGLETQKRLRKSKVLVAGLCGLGAEVAKNLVLAGVKSVTLLDHKKVTALDTAAHIFIRSHDIGKNRAECSLLHCQKLNPMVELHVDTDNLADKNEAFFQSFDAVCITSYAKDILVHVNHICHQNGIKFYVGNSWGFYGFSFSDLGQHQYVEEVVPLHPKKGSGNNVQHGDSKPRKDDLPKQLIIKTSHFVTLDAALSVKSGKVGIGLNKRTSPIFFLVHVMLKSKDKNHHLPEQPWHQVEDLQELLQIRNEVLDGLGVDRSLISDEILSHLDGELSPVCAVIGGVIAQEVIKGLSGKDAPIRNFFLFDGRECSGVVESIGL